MTQAEELTLAAAHQAKCLPDQQRGKGWCKYVLNNWWIWSCGITKRAWAAAHIVDGHYTDHVYFETLEAAFEHAKSQP